jgi:hypothetical protein
MLRFCTFRFHASPGFRFQFRTATGVPAIARDRECREMVANAAFCEMLGIAPETNPSKTGVHADQPAVPSYGEWHRSCAGEPARADRGA